MTQDSTGTIQRAAQTGLGVIDARDLQDSDECGWQRRAPASDSTFGAQDPGTADAARLEVALGREGTPQGPGIVLVRAAGTTAPVHVYDRALWQELVDGILDGQWRMAQ